MGFNDYETLYENYNDIPKTSFDYGIVEKENAISVLRYCGDWMDLGTWNTFTGAMSTNTYGNSMQEECVNTHLINELEMPVLALGIHGTVVAASPDGLIVADKDSSSKLKQYIDRIELRPMYEERIWGTYRVLSMRTEDPCSITKELIIRPGKDISYQKHHKRSENWTIIQGTGQVVINGIIHSVKRGDSVTIKAGMLHAIRAVTELHIIEVQIGSELTEEDIERFDWCWDQ
jgi:mannose-1-phosphate guanylyltransferase